MIVDVIDPVVGFLNSRDHRVRCQQRKRSAARSTVRPSKTRSSRLFSIGCAASEQLLSG